MSKKQSPPTTTATAFDCPHCGAYTTQHWFAARAERLPDDHRTPRFPDEEAHERISGSKDLEEPQKADILKWIADMQAGLVVLDRNERGHYVYVDVGNLHLSECYNCRKVAVWVHQRLVFPAARAGVDPNADLPADIRRDYDEAREIVHSSPRGAAALQRLSVQKLCAHLGERGRTLTKTSRASCRKG